jgi:hypothetical protein
MHWGPASLQNTHERNPSSNGRPSERVNSKPRRVPEADISEGPTGDSVPCSPICYTVCTHMLIIVSPSPSRNATNGRMQRTVARHVSDSASNAWPEAPRLAQGMCARAVCGFTSSISWGSHRDFPTVGEKIKDFLATQGMIKGHSGSGTRTSEQEGILVLVADNGQSDTSSPHSPASVDSSDDHRRPNGHNISSSCYDPHYTSISLSAQHSHTGYPSQRMSFSSARDSSPSSPLNLVLLQLELAYFVICKIKNK